MKTIFTLFLIIYLFHSLNAQWEPMNGPYGGYINDLRNNEMFQFAATPHGLCRSDDEGQKWHQLQLSSDNTYACLHIGLRNNVILTDAVHYADGELKRTLFMSQDNGDHWTEIKRPPSSTYLMIAINKFGFYLADNSHLWVSTDQGETWVLSSINSSIENIYSINNFDDLVYLCAYNKLYKFSPLKDVFEKITIDPNEVNITGFYVSGNLIFTKGSSGKLNISRDAGLTWTSQNITLNGFTAFAKINDTYYITTSSTTFISEDEGSKWTDQHSKNIPPTFTLMIGTSERLITGSAYLGIYSSTDKGKSFFKSDLGISSTLIDAVHTYNQKLFTGIVFSGMSSCDLTSGVWADAPNIKLDQTILDITTSGNNLFAIADEPYKIFKSSDNGISWKKMPINADPRISDFYNYGNSILAGGIAGGNLLTGDLDGTYWNYFFIYVGGIRISQIYLFAQNENTLFVAKRKILYRSLDNGMTWDTAMNGLNLENQFSSFDQLYNFNGTLFATEIKDSTYSTFSKLHVSYDNGDHWQLTGLDLPVNSTQTGVLNLTAVNNILVAYLKNSPEGIFVSFDNAHTWKTFREGLTWVGITDITFDDRYLYAATSGQGVWRRKISDLYTTSTQPISQTNEISIFPNPSKGYFTVKLNKKISGKATLSLSDIHGKICLKKNIELRTENTIETENLLPGLYFLYIESAGKYFTTKLIIQN